MFKAGDISKESFLIDEQMVQKFAEMSGDFNPVHMDENYAKGTRFGKRIAHGMISGALISRCLATHLGTGGIYLGQTIKFVHPVFIGDTVTVEIHVLKVREERGIGIVDTTVTNQKGEVCVKGEATIMAGQFL